MICPKCHSEYREGFHRCAVCECDLVDSLESTGEGIPKQSADQLHPSGPPDITPEIDESLPEEDPDTHCPACGHELHGADKCPECGLTTVFDADKAKSAMEESKRVAEAYSGGSKSQKVLMVTAICGIFILMAGKIENNMVIMLLGGLVTALPIFFLVRS